MKIKAYIIECELGMAKNRLEKLIEMSAPKIMIVAQIKYVEKLSNNEIDINDKESLLDREFTTHGAKTGKGGKVFIEFDNNILYFPQGQYGKFITTKKQL